MANESLVKPELWSKMCNIRHKSSIALSLLYREYKACMQQAQEAYRPLRHVGRADDVCIPSDEAV